MKIRQYVYLTVGTSTIAADELERLLQLPGDQKMVAGSKGRRPLRPVEHAWRVVSDAPGLTIDEHIMRLLARLGSAREAIRELATRDDVSVTLQVVRYLNDETGEEEDRTPAAEGMERLPGQHQLLGWHLSADVIEFLDDIGAQLDVDEYG
jgi:hypothetical protein